MEFDKKERNRRNLPFNPDVIFWFVSICVYVSFLLDLTFFFFFRSIENKKKKNCKKEDPVAGLNRVLHRFYFIFFSDSFSLPARRMSLFYIVPIDWVSPFHGLTCHQFQLPDTVKAN